MELLVVGAGEMGRWVADTVGADRGAGNLAADVAFADLDAERARDAARSRDGRAVQTDTDERFDAVCLAVPISAVGGVVARYADNAERAMVDVSGAMAAPLEAMAEHCPGRERASFHPLFAPPRVPGNVALVADERGPIVDRLVADIEAGGNDVFETTAAEHDGAMETVQAGAHAAILAWRLAADDVREEFHTPVSAGLTDLADTVTEGTPEVYAEIQAAFDGAEDVADAAREIADADPEAFAELYDQARGDGAPRDRHD